MKLYQVKANGRMWFATQADAKRAAREVPNGEAELVDLPLGQGREVFANFLNNLQADAALTVEVMQGIEPVVYEPDADGIQFSPPLKPLPSMTESYEANDIEDFILNRATQAQVENIFSCLGARFGELAKGKQA